VTFAQKKAAPSSPKKSKAPSSKVTAPNKAISTKGSAKPVVGKKSATAAISPAKTTKKSATAATPKANTPIKGQLAAESHEENDPAMDEEDDHHDENSASPKRKAVKKAAKPLDPALNFTCKHSQLQWLSPKDDFNIAMTGPIIEKANGICGGISAGTCCDNEMFENIQKQWLIEIKRKDYLPRVYFGLMKDLLAYRVPMILRFADDIMPTVRKLYKTYKTIPKRQYKAFQYISKGSFSVVEGLRAWRTSALKCSTHMQNVAKGSLCALCHTQGYKRFSDDVYTDPKTSKKKNIVYVPKDDVYDWMQACHTHMLNTQKIMNFLEKACDVV
jgi:hypothetical protein